MLALHKIFIILHSIILLMEKYTSTCLYRVKLSLEEQIYLFAVHICISEDLTKAPHVFEFCKYGIFQNISNKTHEYKLS